MLLPGVKVVVKVIIPAFNEERSVARVISEIDRNVVSQIVVVNNNSEDRTGEEATLAGATVLDEKNKGYGYACLAGMRYLAKSGPPDIVVFIDADYSDYPGELPTVIKPIMAGSVDFVIGSRSLGNRQPGSMLPQQIIGNWIATRLIKVFYGKIYTDLGPFRAIRWDSLMQLNMQDTTYGWTVEMQVKAAKLGLRYTEVPVSYRIRIGKSKVSGTVKGTFLAGVKIILTIFKCLKH